jgi:hypothetical protein
MDQLHIVVKSEMVPRFFSLFQKGVWIRGKVGSSIFSFLSHECGISRDYIEERIQTIFLDGKVVDDLHTSTIKDGSALTLSAAMPGLLGATLRKGGYYSVFRSHISAHEKGDTVKAGEANVKLKLFNLILKELGPGLLREGIEVLRQDLHRLIEGFTKTGLSGIKTVTLNGLDLDIARLSLRKGRSERVLLNLEW